MINKCNGVIDFVQKRDSRLSRAISVYWNSVTESFLKKEPIYIGIILLVQ